MSESRALWFDGVSAHGRSVVVTVDDKNVSLLDDSGQRICLPRSDLSLLTPPHSPRPVLLEAGGGHLVLPSEHLVEELASGKSAVFWTENVIRSNLTAVWAVAILATVLVATLGWLIPRASGLTAQYLPWSAEVRLRAEVLRALDRGYLRPSGLSSDERTRIRARFKVLSEAGGLSGVRLEFRDGGVAVAANAMAIPGKVVVVTDQLIDLLGETRQLDAVLAHELGHVHHRHGAQALMRRTGFSLLIGTLLLDEGLLRHVAEVAPQALLQAAYSREAESEADAFSFRLMRLIGGSPRDFADAISKLEERRGGSTKRASYLQSHPSSADRMEAATAK